MMPETPVRPPTTVRQFAAWLYEKVYLGRSKVGFMADELALRSGIFLCHTHSRWIGGRQWERSYQYRPIGRYQCQGLCDYCQEPSTGTVWVPEEGGYWQEVEESRRHEAAVREQAVACVDRRRVRLVD